MKYYVVSDVHGFFTELETALREKGFFDDTEPHKLIVCGDMLDRGKEAVKMQNFMLDLLHKDELIFIRGNHEDLMVSMLEDFYLERFDIARGASHHNHNGTFKSALQLSGMSVSQALTDSDDFIEKVQNSGFYKELLPASVNYFETDNYIFVHGWIPCVTEDMPAWYQRNRTYQYNPDWRNATTEEWDTARWLNGMAMAELCNIVERGKQIVCGHWHCSYGHSQLENIGSEFDKDADFTPFYSKNIIAIDACTAHSKMINCIVIED